MVNQIVCTSILQWASLVEIKKQTATFFSDKNAVHNVEWAAYHTRHVCK